MEILKLSPQYNQAYESFLKSMDEGILYYSLKYRDFLVDILNCEATYWICVDQGEIVGVLPTMVQEGPYGSVLNSLPFYGSNGGILASAPAAFDALISHFNSLLESEQYAAATLISNPLAPTPADKLKYDVTDERIGQFISLAERKELTFEQFCLTVDSSTRRNIKKAQSAGLTVCIDNSALDFLYECHVENMAAMGGKAKSRRCFELVQKHFVPGEDYDIYVAKKGDMPVSALLLFYYHKTVEYFTPVTRAEFRTEQPMALILYQAITDAANRSFLWWNWGGTWLTQEGVYRFKKKWGSMDLPYRYYTKIKNKALCRMERTQLLEAYGDFYVLPFHILENPIGVTG